MGRILSGFGPLFCPLQTKGRLAPADLSGGLVPQLSHSLAPWFVLETRRLASAITLVRAWSPRFLAPVPLGRSARLVGLRLRYSGGGLSRYSAGSVLVVRLASSASLRGSVPLVTPLVHSYRSASQSSAALGGSVPSVKPLAHSYRSASQARRRLVEVWPRLRFCLIHTGPPRKARRSFVKVCARLLEPQSPAGLSPWCAFGAFFGGFPMAPCYVHWNRRHT